MSTIKDKIIETKKLEDSSNDIREEISKLQNIKIKYLRQGKDTSELEERMEILRNILIPLWESFEVSLREIGEKEYYNYIKGMGVDTDDRYKHY